MSQTPTPAPMAPDVNDNDRLMAALAYFFPVIVPVIILLAESMKVRPYQKYHAAQSLGFTVVVAVYSLIACILFAICNLLVIPALTVATAGLGGVAYCLVPCLILIFFAPPIGLGIYYTIIAYTKSTYFEIPVITNFMVQQKWLTKP